MHKYILVFIIAILGLSCSSHEEDKSLVERNIASLQDVHPGNRSTAAYSLGEMAIYIEPEEFTLATTALVDALDDEAWEVRSNAGYALGHYVLVSNQAWKGFIDEVLPPLVEALQDEKAEVREMAAYALLFFGPGGVEAAQALVEALDDESKMVQGYAIEAIGNIGPGAWEIIPQLIDKLDIEIHDRRHETYPVADAFPGIGPIAIPELITALNHEKERVRAGAALALGKIGAEAGRVVPALIDSMDDESAIVRESVVIALMKFSDEHEVLPSLIQALMDPDPQVCKVAILAVGNLGPGAKDAVPVLVELLSDEVYFIRGNAILALGEIGPGAYEALPKLKELAETDSRDWDRESTLKAIAKIEGTWEEDD